jgi:hypothetical protein
MHIAQVRNKTVFLAFLPIIMPMNTGHHILQATIEKETDWQKGPTSSLCGSLLAPRRRGLSTSTSTIGTKTAPAKVSTRPSSLLI